MLIGPDVTRLLNRRLSYGDLGKPGQDYHPHCDVTTKTALFGKMRHIQCPLWSFSHSMSHLGAVNKKNLLATCKRLVCFGVVPRAQLSWRRLLKRIRLTESVLSVLTSTESKMVLASYHAVTSLWKAFCCMSTSQITS